VRCWRCVSATYPDGSSETTYSASVEGIVDFQKERLADGTVIEHHYGTLSGGDFDKRVTYTQGPEEDTVRIVIDKRTLGGEWQKEEDFVRPNLISCNLDDDSADAGTTSKMTMPPAPEPFVQQKPHGAALEESTAARPEILYNYEPFGGKGELGITILTGSDVTQHCTPEQGLKILSALEAMFELYMRCLHKTNPTMTAEIDRVMSSKDYVVNIGCKSLAANTRAETKAYTTGCTAKRPCEIWFNSTRINALSEMKLQETMLHEFLHTVGFDIDSGAKHDREQNDKTYACGRYCTGCAGRTPSQSSTDCARCADNLERKKNCGHRIVFARERSFPRLFCGQLEGNQPVARECHSWAVSNMYYCDGTYVFPPSHLLGGKYSGGCCESCGSIIKPEGGSAGNSCQGITMPPSGELYNSCNQPPPFCPGGSGSLTPPPISFSMPNAPWSF